MQRNHPIDDDDDFDKAIVQSADIIDKLEKGSARLTTIHSNLDSNSLDTPADFNFPFQPYSIQTDFMVQLFNTIESSRIGIFESPTGTGKSLSLICGSLTWLRLDEERMRTKFDNLTKQDDSKDSGDDWISAFAEKDEKLRENGGFIEKMRQLQQREKDLLQWKKNQKLSAWSVSKFNKRKVGTTTADEKSNLDDADEDERADSDEESLILDGYSSDKESKSSSSIVHSFSETVEDLNAVDTPKIIYCSRTHSQLAQFLNEIKKTSFAKDLRCVVLGSRQTFCVNETVLKLKQVNLINDRCLQFQKDKKDKSSWKKRKSDNGRNQGSKNGCPYQKQNSIQELANSILTDDIRDVEDLISDGKYWKACPYYASRHAVSSAHLVLAPYQILFHQATRDTCGLKLADNIVIVDEAHNLLDTLASIHSVEININQLEVAHVQLQRYLQRFCTRLNAKNLMYVRQLCLILDGLIACLKGCDTETVTGLTEFTFQAGIETVNIFKLLKFMESSHISQKLNGYVNKFGNENDTIFSPFHTVESFLGCLVQKSNDGRILISPTVGQKRGKLKYLHFNPSVFFKILCTEARSIILAGGTMEPVCDLIDQLFIPCHISSQSIHRFSCGHIVDEENLLPLILDKGPSDIAFDFTFGNRNNIGMIGDLGRLLINLANIVPGGIVCFFQSYDYEATVYDQWKNQGILEGIGKKKRIFREPQKSTDVKSVLDNFGKYSKNGTGALMLAVVGGKLSEGINFADELGRMVLMIGLPFPNANSVQLKEKMRILNEQTGGDNRGREYYENICMKAVNQSIGRVIRHKDDYAAILLLDKGYLRPGIQTKLPKWIGNLVKRSETFGTCFGMIKRFFGTVGSKYSK